MMHDAGGLTADHIARVLRVPRGGARQHITYVDLRAAILKGLPYASLEALVAQFHIARKDLVELLRAGMRSRISALRYPDVALSGQLANSCGSTRITRTRVRRLRQASG